MMGSGRPLESVAHSEDIFKWEPAVEVHTQILWEQANACQSQVRLSLQWR